MSRRLWFSFATAVVLTGLSACGSSSESRDRNVELLTPCATGGLCAVGDTGPGGGLVFVGGNSSEDVMWEAAPVNGYGDFSDANVMMETFDFGGLTDWVLPSKVVADEMWQQADVFACGDEADCASAYAADSYWTSERVDGGVAIKSFVDGSDSADAETSLYYIRPVRQFRMGATPIAVSSTTAATEPIKVIQTDPPTMDTEGQATSPATLPPEKGVTTCAEGGPCRAGDIGPTGGTVVLADSIPGESATLIEVAPVTWFGDATQAKGFVDDLVYGGIDGWQVPTLNQLLAIRASRALFVCAKSAPCTNGFANSPYWAVGKVGISHVVDFGGNETGQPTDPAENHYVRPVRVIADLGVSASTEVTVLPTGNFDPEQ